MPAAVGVPETVAPLADSHDGNPLVLYEVGEFDAEMVYEKFCPTAADTLVGLESDGPDGWWIVVLPERATGPGRYADCELSIAMVLSPVIPAGYETTNVHWSEPAGNPEKAQLRMESPADGDAEAEAPLGSVWLTKAHPAGKLTWNPIALGVPL